MSKLFAAAVEKPGSETVSFRPAIDARPADSCGTDESTVRYCKLMAFVKEGAKPLICKRRQQTAPVQWHLPLESRLEGP